VSNDDDDDDDDDGSKLWGKQQNSSLLVLFRGAGESAARDIFFHFVPRRFLNAKGEFERNLSKLLFQASSFSQDFSAKLPRLSLRLFERDILLFFAGAFLFRTFFFRFFFSSLRIIHQRDSLFLHLCVYIYISSLVAQKSFSHHAGARKERSRLLFLDAIVHLSSRVGGVFFL